MDPQAPIKDFAYALAHLKQGHRVHRAGWNGKGMYVFLQPGKNSILKKAAAEATGLKEGSVQKFLPHLVMKTVDDSFVPWLASQTDLLAEDWDWSADPK